MSENRPDSGAQAQGKPTGLLASTLVVSSMTMLSRVLGLVRDMVFTHVLGAGPGTDAFFVAFKIPNLMRRLFAEGAFNQAFVPVLSEYRSRGQMAATRLLVDRVAGTLGGTLVLVTLLGVLAAPWLVWLFAPGFGDHPEKRALTVEMLRLTFPYLFLISLTAFAGGILNSWNRFAVPAFTPVLLNLSLIGSALFLTPYFASGRMAVALAWGVMIAGIVQLLFQLPFLARIHLMPVPRWGWHDPGVRKVMTLMVPALFGASVYQLNSLISTILASMLATGSVTWLYLTDRLIELPMGVFAVAIGTVILPSLSREHASASPQAFARTLNWAVRVVLLVGVPSALALAVLAEPLVSTLFGHGKFTVQDTLLTAQSVRAASIGLLAAMLIKVLAPGFYSRQDTRTPVRIGVIAMCANMAVAAVLVWEFKHVGLAAAMALSAWLNAVLLFVGLRRQGVFPLAPGWGRFLLRLVVASAVMTALCWWLSGQTGVWYDGDVWQRVLWLTGIVVAGLAIYAAALLALGMRVRDLRRTRA